jgi:hypothetical protein
VNDDPSLIVRRTATVKTPVSFDRLEWLALPGLRVAGRLNVMVGVEKDRRVAGRGIATREHGGLPVTGRIRKRLCHYVDVLKNPQRANSFGDELGGTTDVLGGKPIPGHTGNSHQRLEGLEGFGKRCDDS